MHIISLVAPREMANRNPLSSLATPDFVPRDGVRELAAEVANVVLGNDLAALRSKVDAVLVDLDSSLPSVRIEKGAPVKKLTSDESLTRMKAQYKPGRDRQTVLFWANNRISSLGYEYSREYERLERWREKLEAKGGKLAPDEIHYTFPELLRASADAIEAADKEARAKRGA